MGLRVQRRKHKMAYGLSTEGGYGIGASTDHVDASHAEPHRYSRRGASFRGHFARSGPDLVLTGQDGHRIVATGFFTTEKHPDLVAPNGAHRDGDLIDLSGRLADARQYAQARNVPCRRTPSARSEKVVGQGHAHSQSASPVRCMSAIRSTRPMSSRPEPILPCGIAFPDGTALDLVNNSADGVSTR